MTENIISHYTSPDALPRDLPTRDEIMSSDDWMCDQTGRKVVGVGPHFVVNHGMQIDLSEGQAMLYVAKNTSVPVPKVYALYEDVDDRRKYIIMERVQRCTLEHLWPSLTKVQKESICARLKSSLAELRALPSPGSFCGLNNVPLADNLFCISDNDQNFYQDGPFETEEDLNKSLLRTYSSSEGLRGKAKYYERVLPSVFCGHLSVFTHGDLQKRTSWLKVARRGISCLDMSPNST